MKKLEIKAKKNDDVMATKVYKRVEQFLKKRKFNYHLLENGSPEAIIHGDNLIMKLNYHYFGNHLVVRVSDFVRNAEVMRPKVIFLVNQLMQEMFSVRFELNPEVGSISANCQHVVVDRVPSVAQLETLTGLVLSVVDDSYQKFMQAIYGPEGEKSIEAVLNKELGEFSDDYEGYERPTDSLKIN